MYNADQAQIFDGLSYDDESDEAEAPKAEPRPPAAEHATEAGSKPVEPATRPVAPAAAKDTVIPKSADLKWGPTPVLPKTAKVQEPEAGSPAPKVKMSSDMTSKVKLAAVVLAVGAAVLAFGPRYFGPSAPVVASDRVTQSENTIPTAAETAEAKKLGVDNAAENDARLATTWLSQYGTYAGISLGRDVYTAGSNEELYVGRTFNGACWAYRIVPGQGRSTVASIALDTENTMCSSEGASAVANALSEAEAATRGVLAQEAEDAFTAVANVATQYATLAGDLDGFTETGVPAATVLDTAGGAALVEYRTGNSCTRTWVSTDGSVGEMYSC